MRRALAPRLLLLGWIALATGCGEDEPPATTPTVEPPAPPPEPVPPPQLVEDAPEVDRCGTLNRMDCLDAPDCTLDPAPASDAYVCRPAEGPCEVGMTVSQESEDRCYDLAPECLWTDGSCYCPCRGAGRTAVEDGDEALFCECPCVGGPPPGCRAR